TLCRSARDVARIAGERLMRKRIMHEALNVQSLFRAEGINVSRRWVWEQGHVRFIDGSKAIDGGAVKSHSIFCDIFIEFRGWDAEAWFFAGDVGKADVNKFYDFISDELRNLRDAGKCHGCS